MVYVGVDHQTRVIMMLEGVMVSPTLGLVLVLVVVLVVLCATLEQLHGGR